MKFSTNDHVFRELLQPVAQQKIVDKTSRASCCTWYNSKLYLINPCKYFFGAHANHISNIADVAYSDFWILNFTTQKHFSRLNWRVHGILSERATCPHIFHFINMFWRDRIVINWNQWSILNRQRHIFIFLVAHVETTLSEEFGLYRLKKIKFTMDEPKQVQFIFFCTKQREWATNRNLNFLSSRKHNGWHKSARDNFVNVKPGVQ